MLSKLKRWIQNTIGLSSSEANAMIVLLPVIFLIIFSQPVYRLYAASKEPISIKEEWILDSLSNSLMLSVDSIVETQKFEFDPNKASLDEFKSLGITEYVSKRIIQYRAKGGEFRVKADLQKIYGFDSTLYNELMPFIQLPDQIVKTPIPKAETITIPVELDLNLTDTTSLKTVKGIGSVLSRRIINYRTSLGGFINSNQLKEVYGLDSIVIRNLSSFFVDEEFQPTQIKINETDEAVLSKHPYLSAKEARAIITYRQQHGKFSSLIDLQKIKTLKESSIARIGPYLSFE